MGCKRGGDVRAPAQEIRRFGNKKKGIREGKFRLHVARGTDEAKLCNKTYLSCVYLLHKHYKCTIRFPVRNRRQRTHTYKTRRTRGEKRKETNKR